MDLHRAASLVDQGRRQAAKSPAGIRAGTLARAPGTDERLTRATEGFIHAGNVIAATRACRRCRMESGAQPESRTSRPGPAAASTRRVVKIAESFWPLLTQRAH